MTMPRSDLKAPMLGVENDLIHVYGVLPALHILTWPGSPVKSPFPVTNTLSISKAGNGENWQYYDTVQHITGRLTTMMLCWYRVYLACSLVGPMSSHDSWLLKSALPSTRLSGPHPSWCHLVSACLPTCRLLCFPLISDDRIAPFALPFSGR